jgi:hypothetical protein
MKTVILLSSGSRLELYINEDNMKRILKPVEGVRITKDKIKSTTSQTDLIILDICRKGGIKGVFVSKSGEIRTLDGERVGEQLTLFSK